MRTFIIILFFSFCFRLTAQKVQQAEKNYKSALEAYRNRQLDLAEDLILTSIRFSKDAKSNYLAGLIYEAQNKPLRAIAAYENALILDEENHEARFQKAVLYLQNGDPAQALKDFDFLVDLGGFNTTNSIFFEVDPLGRSQHKVRSLSRMTSRLYYYRGQAHEKLDHFDLAYQDYELAIVQDSVADYFIAKGLLNRKIGDDQKAIIDLRKALDLDSSNERAWYNLALIDDDVLVPEELVRDEAFVPILNLLAVRAIESENYDLAVEYLDQSISNDSSDPLTYVNRGRALLKMKKYKKARSDFENAQLLDETRAEVLYLIGNSYFYEKSFSKALVYYDHYLSIDPTNGMIWYNAASCLLKEKETKKACHYLRQADIFGMSQMVSQQLEKYCTD